jgi:hypothetical protein
MRPLKMGRLFGSQKRFFMHWTWIIWRGQLSSNWQSIVKINSIRVTIGVFLPFLPVWKRFPAFEPVFGCHGE